MTVTFSDIRAMVASRPALASAHDDLCSGVMAFLNDNAIRLSSEWADIINRICIVQNIQWPQFHHPRVALYAANYGQDMEAVQKRLDNLAQQNDPLTQLCAVVNADLRVYELDLTTQVPATGISEGEAAHAMSYGLMAVEEHVDCLVPSTLGEGNASIIHACCDALRNNDKADALTTMLSCGAGADMFALVGAVLAARMAKIPVFITQKYAELMTYVLRDIVQDDALTHCILLPENLHAGDVIQTLGALQNLQFMLALVPVKKPARSSSKPVLPSAAA